MRNEGDQIYRNWGSSKRKITKCLLSSLACTFGNSVSFGMKKQDNIFTFLASANSRSIHQIDPLCFALALTLASSSSAALNRAIWRECETMFEEGDFYIGPPLELQMLLSLRLLIRLWPSPQLRLQPLLLVLLPISSSKKAERKNHGTSAAVWADSASCFALVVSSRA